MWRAKSIRRSISERIKTPPCTNFTANDFKSDIKFSNRVDHLNRVKNCFNLPSSKSISSSISTNIHTENIEKNIYISWCIVKYIYMYIYKPWLQGRSTVHRRATTSGAWAFATTWGCPRNTPPRNRTSLPVPRRWASLYRGPTCRGLSAFPACPDARRAGRGGREEGCNNDRYSYLRNSLVLSRVLFFFFFFFFYFFFFFFFCFNLVLSRVFFVSLVNT